MIYYKGFIVGSRYIKTHKCEFKIGEDLYSHAAYDLSEIVLDKENITEIPADLKKMLKKYILEREKKNITGLLSVENESICEYFRNQFKSFIDEKVNIINGTSIHTGGATFIIYELVKDIDGNIFGRELYTNELFPVYSSKSQLFNYLLRVKREGNVEYHRYDLTIKCDVKVSSLLKCENIIVSHTVADKNDVEKYKNIFNHQKGFFKRRNERDLEYFKERIISYANANVFKEDFRLEENKPKEIFKPEKQSIETTLMEDIDYSLMKLKNINQELYLEYKNRYDKLLDGDYTLENLSILAGDIEFYLTYKKREIGDILEILNNLKKEYLINFLNNNDKKTELDIKKIDKMNELFLKIKDKYSYKDQREVLRNLAFLYLMEIYENRDIIDIDTLEHSYFVTHLKTIVVWINLLIDEDVIECGYLTSLRDQLNIKIVFDMINNIKFKKIDDLKVMKLIGNL